MLISYKRGQTSVVFRVKILNSSATDGSGRTSLAFNTAGLTIATIADNEAATVRYRASFSEIEDITTLGTYSAPSSGKCRFKEVDATNHPGVYEVQLLDARFAVTSAKSLLVSITGASDVVETDVLIPLRDINPYDVVRGGMTALPNAAAEAAGGLYTRGTGAGQINQPFNGQIDANAVSLATNSVGSAQIASNAIGASEIATDAIEAIADQVWDEILTGATHNIPTSAGRRLRQLASAIVSDGTAQAGSADTITLAAGESATNDIYQLNYVTIVGGTGAGQTRVVVDYDGTSKVATVSRNWNTNPSSDSEYVISANANSLVSDLGAPQAATTTSITLRAAASADDDSYIGQTISIVAGTGREQSRIITAYNGTTKVATVNKAWGTTPDTTSDYIVWLLGRAFIVGGLADSINASLLATDAVNEIRDSMLSDSTPFNGADIASILGDTGTDGVKVDMTQAVPTSNTAETLGDALNAARAQGFGKWVKTGTTLELFANDGSTVVRTFTLDSATDPTSRT